MRKKIKSKVLSIMNRNKSTRDNDNLLIAKVLKDLYGTSDMEDIAKITNASVTETITRMRRKIQQTNPLMASSAKASKARRRKEAEWHEAMIKEI